MNSLLTESFERVIGKYPGEVDIESGNGFRPSREMSIDHFFRQIGEIEKQIEKITDYLHKLQAANEETQRVTKASAMKEIKVRMEKDIEDVTKIALKIKTSIEKIDKENIANRQKPNCGEGSGVDRSRTAMTVALKKKLKERMSQFQTLRQAIHDDYREVVERRVYTVTGNRPGDETIDHLIETGKSEQIFTNAIQGYGRGHIVDTLKEIQERHDAVLDLEKKLVDLQQMFMDMSVLVDAQGDLLNDIETQVVKSVEHVQKATTTLQDAKKLQKNTRKYTCFAIIILLIVIATTLAAIFKDAKP